MEAFCPGGEIVTEIMINVMCSTTKQNLGLDLGESCGEAAPIANDDFDDWDSDDDDDSICVVEDLRITEVMCDNVNGKLDTEDCESTYEEVLESIMRTPDATCEYVFPGYEITGGTYLTNYGCCSTVAPPPECTYGWEQDMLDSVTEQSAIDACTLLVQQSDELTADAVCVCGEAVGTNFMAEHFDCMLEPNDSEGLTMLQEYNRRCVGTFCASHADCTDVENEEGEIIGDTYCYDEGIFTSDTANGVFKCALTAQDCCECRDNDSFDQDSANCPVESDCSETCASVDCVVDEAATQAQCTSECGSVPVIGNPEASNGGASCDPETYLCQYGNGECTAATTSPTTSPTTPPTASPTTSPTTAASSDNYKIKWELSFSDMDEAKFNEVKDSIKKVVAEAAGKAIDAVKLIFRAVTTSRRRLNDATVETEVEADSEEDANSLSSELGDVTKQELADDLQDQYDADGVGSPPTLEAVEAPTIQEPTATSTETDNDDSSSNAAMIIVAVVLVIVAVGLLAAIGYMWSQDNGSDKVADDDMFGKSMDVEMQASTKRGPETGSNAGGGDMDQDLEVSGTPVGGADIEGVAATGDNRTANL